MQDNQTLTTIKAKQKLGLPLTDHERAMFTLYGENTHCSKTNCVYSGGGCKYTTNIDYAVNAVKRTPSIITAADTDDDVVYYDDEKCAVDRTEV